VLTDPEPTAIALNGTPTSGRQVAAVYRCRAKPENLRETDHPDVKFCDACRQKIFKVMDFDGFERAVASRGCVWGPNDIGPNLPEEQRLFFGMPAIDYEPPGPLRWDE
jgi:hypothetical protein